MPNRNTNDQRTFAEVMEVETIGKIAARDYPASRDELIHYYKKYTCAGTSDRVLMLMSNVEIRRLTFIGVYAEQYSMTENRGRVVKRVAEAVGVAWRTGFRYAKQYDRTRVQQVK